MTWVDLVIVLLLCAAAVRGFLRGVFREALGLLGILGATLAAEHGAPAGAPVAQSYLSLPAPVSTGVAFVLIFALVHSLFILIGGLLERAVVRPLARAFSGVAGAVVGASKAGVVCALVLLLLRLFPVLPSVNTELADSLVARSLISVAGLAMRLGMHGSIRADRRDQT